MWTWFKVLVGLTKRPAPTPDVPEYDPLSSIKFVPEQIAHEQGSSPVILPLVKPAPIVQSKLKTSDKGLAIIEEFEGFRSKAYLCPAGIWTIGFGHTSGAGLPHVYKGMKVTKDEARHMLRRDVVQYEQAVLRSVKASLSQNEFDALVSFCYNVGVTAFSKSTVVRVINAGKKAQVGAALAMWVKGGGKVLPGLVSRRAKECDLFYGKAR